MYSMGVCVCLCALVVTQQNNDAHDQADCAQRAVQTLGGEVHVLEWFVRALVVIEQHGDVRSPMTSKTIIRCQHNVESSEHNLIDSNLPTNKLANDSAVFA